MVTRAVRVAAAAALLVGCPVEIPEDRFGCARGEACPPGMACGAEGLCVRASPGVDAAAVDAGSVDASGLDAVLADAALGDTGDDAFGVDAPGSPGCSLDVTSVEVLGGRGAEDVVGAHVLGPMDERLAINFDGDFRGMSALGTDALVTRRADGAMTPALWLSGAADSVLSAMSLDGQFVAGTTGPAMSGATPVAVRSVTGAFVYDATGDVITVLDSMDEASSVRAHAITRMADDVCVGGSFRGGFDPDGTFVMSEGTDGFVVCQSARGARSGGLSFPGPGDQEVLAVAADGGGELYVAGRDGTNLFIARLDGSLRETARLSFGASGGPSSLSAIALTPDAVYAAGQLGPGTVSGLSVDAGTDDDVIILRFDRSLSLRWAVTEDDPGRDVAHAIAIDRCGRVLVAGGVRGSTSSLDAVPALRAYDASGVLAAERIASGGTGFFRSLVFGEREVLAVGAAYSAVQIGDAGSAAVGGASDALIVRFSL